MMLKQGDIVDLIAPSSGFGRKEYNSCLKIVEDFVLKPRVLPYGELIDSSCEFVSNDKDVRFEQLEKALKNNESKAIWCMAGGYGSYHLLEMLDKIPAPLEKKIFIGFSDNTALLNFLVSKWNYPCIYGPPLLQIAQGGVTQSAVDNIKKVVFENKFEEIKLEPLNDRAKRQGQITGKIVGGCLSLVQTTLGTSNKIDTRGKIVLLEDDKFETPGRVDRIFNHLGQADFFNGASAVILGSFLEEEFENKKTAFIQAVENLKKNIGVNTIPLFKAENIGHCKDMVSVPFGTFVNIKTGDEPVLKIGL